MNGDDVNMGVAVVGVIVNRRVVSQEVLSEVSKIKGFPVNSGEDLDPSDHDLVDIFLEVDDYFWGSKGDVSASIEYVPKDSVICFAPAENCEVGSDDYREQLINITNLKQYKI